MFAARKTAYVKADDAQSSREDRMTRLKFELREHIRFLADYEILSTDWLRMAESLHQIANVAFMETHLPPTEENPLLQHGKKGTGTLWDQERDELAIRILLEEGKLNLVLRILHKYKQASCQGDVFEKQIKSTCEKFNSDIVTVTERCRVFEQSLGILLKFALQHVEALQIIDLPEFMTHVGEILDQANNSEKKQNNSTDAEKMQDTLVIHYLASIGAKLEDLDEDRVMDLAEQNNIIPTLISHLHKHYTWYKIETLEAASKFLSAAIASEPYGTEKNRFIRDTACIKQLVDLKGYFIHELVTVYGLKKKDIQPLLDELIRYERQVGVAVIVPLKPKLNEAHGEIKIEKEEKNGKKKEEEKKEAEKPKDEIAKKK